MIGEILCTWRTSTPVSVLVNPEAPQEVDAFLTGAPRQVGSFIVDTNGDLWIVDAHHACHGDVERGDRVLPPEADRRDRRAELVVSGSIHIDAGRCWRMGRPWAPAIPGSSKQHPRTLALLHQFPAWRRIADQVEIVWGRFPRQPNPPIPDPHVPLGDVLFPALLEGVPTDALQKELARRSLKETS